MKKWLLGTAIYRFYRLFFVRKVFYGFNKLIFNLSLRGVGILNYESTKLSGEENFIKNYISKIEKGIIFDVGANVGSYSKTVRELNQAVEIYAFEPHPVTFKKLLENIGRLGIKTFNIGVGSVLGTSKLYDYANNDGSSHASLYREVIEDIHKEKAVEHEVEMITLKAFTDEHKIERVHLLKIDTEGHEIEVLKGFEQFIRENRIDLIHFEFNEMNIVSRVFFKDFWNLLPNYEFYRMLPDGLVPMGNYTPNFYEIFSYQNIVAMLKQKKDLDNIS